MKLMLCRRQSLLGIRTVGIRTVGIRTVGINSDAVGASRRKSAFADRIRVTGDQFLFGAGRNSAAGPQRWNLFPRFFAVLLCAFAIASAQAAPKQARRPLPTQEQIQIEGIVAGVVNKLWIKTDDYWHHGDYPRIVALDQIITEADPQFLEAYATGGWLMDSLGRTADAEAYYALGTRNNPKAEYAYWNLGMFYFNTKHDYRSAAQAMRSAVSQPDADLNDWKMLCHSYEKAGEWDKAVAAWQQTKARYPNGASVDRLLAEAIEKRHQTEAGNGKPRP